MTPAAPDPATPNRFARFIAPARARAGLIRLLAGLGLILAVYLGLNGGLFALTVRILGTPRAEDIALTLASGATPGAALTLLASFLPLIAGTWLVVRLLHRRPFATLFGPSTRLGQDVIRATGLLLVLFLPYFALWSLFFDTLPNLSPGLWLALLPLSLAGIALQTLAEELVFRGYLIQQLAARGLPRLIWAGGPAMLFAALHIDPTGTLGMAGPIAALLFALIATDLTVRSGGLGLAWGLHLANNLVAITGIATGPVLSGLALRLAPYGPAALITQPLLLAAEILPILIAWLILRARLRRSR
ncbi:MAG: CPBP family intramembrane glutamic endopeptidase [Qingshengfaniella sp.]